jgi:SAM-dependent methyltransferase
MPSARSHTAERDLATPHLHEPTTPLTEFVHRLPDAHLVDRFQYLLGVCRGKRVIDLGFVDEGRMTTKRTQRAWLHELLSRSARELVGIDSDAGGVRLARELGFESYAADCQSGSDLIDLELEHADVVVAGELIEHLDRPGDFLEAVKTLVGPTGVLVLTTPNAARLTNLLGSLAHRELANPDRVAWYSWHTLKTLFERHGWQLQSFGFYPIPRLAPPRSLPGTERLKLRTINAVRAAMRPLFLLRPGLADGIVAEAYLTSQHSKRLVAEETQSGTVDRDDGQQLAR